MRNFFSARKFYKSFSIAFSGIKTAFQKEQSFRLQVFAALAVLVLMFLFPLSLCERTILVWTMSAVLGFELLNSQLEKILDIIQPNESANVKIVKDFSAAAVLIVSLGALVIGLIVFFPYIFR